MTSTVLTTGRTVKIYSGPAFGVTQQGLPEWDRPIVHYHDRDLVTTKLSKVRCKVLSMSGQPAGMDGAWAVVESTRSGARYALDLSDGKWLPYD